MIARGFKSVIWVATVGSAALGCYMVSLRVATERNELAKVERQIVAAKQDIRSLQTELGTRGRMTQLEEWNANVLALSAPSSAQYLQDAYTLARLDRHEPTVAERSAEVRLVSAEAGPPAPAVKTKTASPPVVQAVAQRPATQPPLVHTASFTTAEATAKPRTAPKPVATQGNRPAATAAAKPAKPAPQRLASTAPAKPAAKPAPTGGKPAASAAKPVREASATAGDKGKGGGGN